MAATLAAVMVAQNAGCGSAPTRMEVQTECSDDATRVLSESNGTTGPRQAIFEYKSGGQSRCAVVAPPRRYLVAVVVQWSNGWVEHYEVTTDLSAEPRQRYFVLAYEKGKGQIPVKT